MLVKPPAAGSSSAPTRRAGRSSRTLHDGNGTRVAIVNAFTTVNRDTDAIVRAVDYQAVGSPEQFRVYSDDVDDVARWTRV